MQGVLLSWEDFHLRYIKRLMAHLLLLFKDHKLIVNVFTFMPVLVEQH